MRKKSDKPKLNDISINYYDFKTVEIIKVRKILRKHSLKGLKRHDKVTWDSAFLKHVIGIIINT